VLTRSGSTRGRVLNAVLAAVCGLGLFAPVAAWSAGPNYRMGPYTLRDCRGKSPADPVNIAFFGTHGSWQNSQRAVGYDYDVDDDAPPGEARGLKWRTTGGLAGGSQSIMNGAACTRMDSQSSRGSGFRSGPNAKRHTRFFEQILAFSLNTRNEEASSLTVQDAHRDLKSRQCAGPGSRGQRLNDRVPRKVDGFRDGGYNNAAQLFKRGFPPSGSTGRVAPRFTDIARTPHRMRFVQCGYEEPPLRYTVGWNGVVNFFSLYGNVPCQDSRRPFDDDAWRFGNCPLGGRVGQSLE